MKYTLQLNGWVYCVNPDGSIAWKTPCGMPKINGVTYAGIDAMLNGDVFGENLYFGLISATSFTGVSAGDTGDSHSGWSESTAYDEATRPQWDYGTASGRAFASNAPASFTINAQADLRGVAIFDGNTKGGTSDLLLATLLFPAGQQAKVAGQTVNVNLTMRMAGQ